jgi:5'-3' exonuclease
LPTWEGHYLVDAAHGGVNWPALESIFRAIGKRELSILKDNLETEQRRLEQQHAREAKQAALATLHSDQATSSTQVTSSTSPTSFTSSTSSVSAAGAIPAASVPSITTWVSNNASLFSATPTPSASTSSTSASPAAATSPPQPLKEMPGKPLIPNSLWSAVLRGEAVRSTEEVDKQQQQQQQQQQTNNKEKTTSTVVCVPTSETECARSTKAETKAKTKAACETTSAPVLDAGHAAGLQILSLLTNVPTAPPSQVQAHAVLPPVLMDPESSVGQGMFSLAAGSVCLFLSSVGE